MGELKDIFDHLRTGDHRSSQERGRLIGEGLEFPFEKVSRVHTIAKFEVEYRLRGRICLKDTYANEDKHLWEKDYERLCRKFDDQVIHLAVLGTWHFFVLSWERVTNELGTLAQPVVLLCQPSSKDGVLRLKALENGRALVEASKKVELVTHGWIVRWRVELEEVEWGVWDQELMERNYSMLELQPKVLEKVTGDVLYQEYEEMVAVAALKRRLEIQKALQLGQTEQEHGGDANWFTLKTTGVAGKLRISWKVKGGWSDTQLSGYRIQGTRFPEPIKDAKGKPTPRLSGEEVVVDARENNHVDLHVGEGVECAFSFVLVKGTEGLLSSPTVDRINFRVRMPTAEETMALEALLFEMKQLRKAQAKPDPVQENVERVLKKVRAKVKTSTALLAEKEKSKRETQASPEFQALSKAEQVDVLSRIDEYFTGVWDEV